MKNKTLYLLTLITFNCAKNALKLKNIQKVGEQRNKVASYENENFSADIHIKTREGIVTDYGASVKGESFSLKTTQATGTTGSIKVNEKVKVKVNSNASTSTAGGTFKPTDEQKYHAEFGYEKSTGNPYGSVGFEVKSNWDYLIL